MANGEYELVLALDPGEFQGWSLFNAEDRRLLACGLGDGPSVPVGHEKTAIVVECPQIYNSGTSKANPASIIKLAVRVGVQLERYRTCTPYLVSPRAWAGQVPKKVRHERLLATLPDLDWSKVASKITPSKRHNVLDAIGIGLWFCSLSSLTRERYRCTL